MPVDQLESLVDNPAIRETLSVILERTDQGEAELRWADVRDAVSSTQWGRLIQEGLLVSGASGFVLANPDRVREHLDSTTAPETSRPTGEQPEATTEIETRPWTRYDKLAGVTTLVLFAGYYDQGIRGVVASIDDVLLSPVTDVLPFYAVVLLLAAVTGLYSTVLQGRLMDTEAIQAYKDRMNRLNERKQAAKERGDDAALEAIQQEQLDAAGDQLGMFKLQFRPMVWIMLMTIPVFLWLRWKVRGGHLGLGETGLVVPLAGAVSWQDPLFGPMSTWLVWYFLCSMAARQLVRKTLGIQTNPGT